jgi:hypothetical protein
MSHYNGWHTALNKDSSPTISRLLQATGYHIALLAQYGTKLRYGRQRLSIFAEGNFARIAKQKLMNLSDQTCYITEITRPVVLGLGGDRIRNRVPECG